MFDFKKLFINFFDDEDITSPRLSTFAANAVSRFRTNDSANRFPTLIAQLNTAQIALATELSDVSGAVALRKGKTLVVDGVKANFIKRMSTLEGVIANAFGGRETEGFLAFYPAGVDEYSRVTKTNMPTLTKRVLDMAMANATTLGTALTTELKSFENAWKTARNAQQDKKGTVSANRTQRTAARVAVELVLLDMIHQVASAFKGDVAQCGAYFDFSILAVPRHSSLEDGPDGPDVPVTPPPPVA